MNKGKTNIFIQCEVTENEDRDQENNDPVFHRGDSKTMPIRQNSGARETLSQEDDSWTQAKYRFAAVCKFPRGTNCSWTQAKCRFSGVCKFPERHKLLLDSLLVTLCPNV